MIRPPYPAPALRRGATIVRAVAPCLALLLLVAVAPAQGVYRCTENGRTVYSDKPCPGGTLVDTRPAAGGPVAAPTAPAADAPPPAARPAAPAKAAPAKGGSAPPAGSAPLGLGYISREQACAEGSKKACDEIACLRDDAGACARIGGGVRGSGWYEVSRRRETRAGKNDLGKTTLQRVMVLTIRCTGPAQRSGEISMGRGSITIPRSTINYSSVDTAAAAICKR